VCVCVTVLFSPSSCCGLKPGNEAKVWTVSIVSYQLPHVAPNEVAAIFLVLL